MARVYDNAITMGTIGTLGNVYFRVINGKTYVSKMPVRTSPRSKKQKSSSRKFKKAVSSALAALKDPVRSAIRKEAAVQPCTIKTRKELLDFHQILPGNGA